MDHEETPDMVYGRLLEATHVSGYTFERACAELDYLLTQERWRHLGPAHPTINAFLRSLDFSAFNLAEKRPQLIQRIKELQPDASNRAIAEAIGVSDMTVGRDLNAATHVAPEPPPTADCEGTPDEVATSVALEPEPEEDEDVTGETSEGPEPEATADDDRVDAEGAVEDAVGEEDDDEEEPPDFLDTEGWTSAEQQHAYDLYVGLPADLQPIVDALVSQPGICVPDILTMLEQITTMDEGQRAELVRLQTSPDAYERSCAITMALNRPPPPHPRLMLVLEVRRELVDLSRRLDQMATRYPDLPGTPEVLAWGGRLALVAEEAEAVIRTLQACKEVASARGADVSAVV